MLIAQLTLTAHVCMW